MIFRVTIENVREDGEPFIYGAEEITTRLDHDISQALADCIDDHTTFYREPHIIASLILNLIAIGAYSAAEWGPLFDAAKKIMKGNKENLIMSPDSE